MIRSGIDSLKRKIIKSKYIFKYGKSSPDFYETIRVDPSNIEYFVYPAFYRDGRIPRIVPGPWDNKICDESIRDYDAELGRAIFPIKDYSLYQSMYRHFKKDTDWKETEFYSIVHDKIEHGPFWHGCTSIEDIHDRFNYIDRIYNDIKNNGYKSSQELNQGITGEITVDICRNGEIVMDDGRHRLFISKILDLDEIPVWILVRHKEWQEIRRKLHDVSDPATLDEWSEDYFNHPDIQDVITSENIWKKLRI